MPIKDRDAYNAYQRKWYEENRQVYLDKNQRNRVRLKNWMTEQKNNPCMDCGVSYPACVMEWDHRPGTEKRFDLSAAVRNMYGIDTLQAEIDKCDLVCANCHRLRTAERSSLA